jgi:putative transposase
MLIHKAFVFKLKPTGEQEQAFWRYVGACRWVWNRFLDERQTAYKETGESLSMYEQKRQLSILKAQSETSWLSEIHSQVLQEVVLNLQRAFQNFFDKRAASPRFKSRKNPAQSFSYPQGVKVDENQVYLPKIGWVRFRKSREVEGAIKRATVHHKASGWYVSILCEIEVPDPMPTPLAPSTTIGLDLGLTDFVVTSNGERVPAPKFLRKAEKKLAKAQRALARCKRGSNRYAKQKRKVARLYERVANARKHFLHQLSTRLVRENQAIVAENLSVKGLARTRLAKSVHDAGWGEFLRQVAYKCEWQGKVFHQIDRFFPSSKLHAACGMSNTLSLSDRTFVCQGCGEVLDRDLNAAQNIKRQGLKELLAAG